MSPRVASLLSCVQLSGPANLCSFQQMNFKALQCQFSREEEESLKTSQCQQHIHYHPLVQYPSVLYAVLLSSLKGAVKSVMVILHYMIGV